MKSEKELLKERFEEELKDYSPNWCVIAKTNQTPTKCKDYDAYTQKVDAFCNAIVRIQKSRSLTKVQMAERLGYSRQYLHKIEKLQIKDIPLDRLEDICDVFGVSQAYLLGLIDDDTEFPSAAQCYFWEYPQNDYCDIKDEVITESYLSPMVFFGASKEELLKYVSEKLKDDYELLNALKKIYNSHPKKREYIFNCVINFSHILSIR